jgi:WD40 repeat protein
MKREDEQFEAFLERQFQKLSEWNEAVVSEGLLLDFLYEHISEEKTTTHLSRQDAEERYGHLDIDLDGLIGECKKSDILVDCDANDDEHSPATRLAYDEMAPVISELYGRSDRPGQKARKLLEHRAEDWSGTTESIGGNAFTRALHEVLGIFWKALNRGRGKAERPTLHAIDVQTVERGRFAMRGLRVAEQNLLLASKTSVQLNKAVLFVLTTALFLFFGSLAAVQVQKRAAEERSYAARVVSQAESLLKENDPLTAALLIASLEDYEEPPNGVRIAHEIAKQAIPWDIYAHDKNVNSIACSVDGKEVLIGSEDGALIWNTRGAETQLLELEGRHIVGAVFNRSLEGPKIATFDDGNEIRVWERKRLPVVVSEDGVEATEKFEWCDTVVGHHENEIVSLEFSLGGGRLLATSINLFELEEDPDAVAKAKLMVWDVEGIGSASTEHCPEGPRSNVLPVVKEMDGYQKASFSSRNGYWIAAINAEADSAQLFSATNYEPIGDPISQLDADGVAVGIEHVEFSRDNKQLLIIHESAPASLWSLDLGGENPPAIIDTDFPKLRAARFMEDRRLLTASTENQLTAWQMHESPDGRETNLTPIMGFTYTGEQVTGMDFCRDTGQIITSHLKNRNDLNDIRLWNPRGSAEPLVVARSLNGVPASSARFSPDGSRFAVTFNDPRRDQSEKTRIYHFPDQFTIEETEAAAVWELDYSELPHALSVDFSPDGNKVMTVEPAGDDGSAIPTEWALSPHSFAAPVRGPEVPYTGKLRNAAYDESGENIVGAPEGSATSAELWKYQRSNSSGEEKFEWVSQGPMTHLGQDLFNATFSPSDDGTIVTSPKASPYDAIFGNIKPESQVKKLPHTQPVRMSVFSPGGSHIATASDDGLIRLFDIQSAPNGQGELEPVRKFSVGRREDLPTFNAASTSVAFSPDGTQLMGSSNEGKAWVWSLDGTRENVFLSSGRQRINSAEFSPATFSDDGSPLGPRVLTASQDGVINLWRYQWDDLVEAINRATRICLTAEERVIYLGEPETEAAKLYEECLNKS